MLIRNLRVVPVLLRYSGYRKISIGRKGLSERVPIALANSHNVIRDVQRRVIELVYEPGELTPAEQKRGLVQSKAIEQAELAQSKAKQAEEVVPVAPKVDGIAERMLERLRMIKPEGAATELERLRRMANMNPQMAGTVATVIKAYEAENKIPTAVQVITNTQPADTFTESPTNSTSVMNMSIVTNMPIPESPDAVNAVVESQTSTVTGSLLVEHTPGKATPEQRYSRTSVRKMRRDDLIGVAREVNIAEPQNLTVQQLKDALIDKLPPLE